MRDLQKHIEKRKKIKPEFEENFDAGYQHFKSGRLSMEFL